MIDNNQIPSSWEIVKLGDLFSYVIGGDWGKDISYASPDYELAYCIRGSEFKNWEEEKGRTASLRKIKKTSIENRRLKEGDILIEISGGGPEQPVGRTVVIDKSVLAYKPDVPKVCTNFLRLARPTDYVEPKFLNFYLKLFYGSGKIVNYQGGSNNLRNLKFLDYIQIEIPLPPLPEQHRIVSKIEELFTELDKGIEILKTTQQQLKVYRQAVLKWAFEGKFTNENVKEGELPKGWEWKKIKEIGKVVTGTTPSKKNPEFYSSRDYPFFKPTDLEAGTNVAFSIDSLSEQGIKEARFVPENSTLVTCIGATIGKTGFIRKGGGFNQQINAIIPFKEFNPKFVFYQAISPAFQNQIKDNASATTLPILNKGRFEILPFVICPISEQTKIVHEIESRLSVCDKMEETIETTLQQAEALRLSILKKAFEGKLVAQNPKDEPAAKLLERIRAQKTKKEPQKKSRRDAIIITNKRKSKPNPKGVK